MSKPPGHRFDLDDRVIYWGRPAKVIALTTEPSCTIEFTNGIRLTVGQSVLELNPNPEGGQMNDPRYNTRPFAADVSDATAKLGYAIENALDVTYADSAYAEVEGVLYEVRPVVQ